MKSKRAYSHLPTIGRLPLLPPQQGQVQGAPESERSSAVVELVGLAYLPLDRLVWRVAFVPPVVVAADELVAEHFAGHFGVAAAAVELLDARISTLSTQN